MPSGLVRYEQCGDQHFVTFSCFQRLHYLDSGAAKGPFEQPLEQHQFSVLGYVVMPEHVHPLVNKPRLGILSHAIQAMTLSAATRINERSFCRIRMKERKGQYGDVILLAELLRGLGDGLR